MLDRVEDMREDLNHNDENEEYTSFLIHELRDSIEKNDTQERIVNTVSLVEQCSESGLTEEAEDLICKYPLPKEADEHYYERY